ncbi:hypothetical protein C0J52_22219 [Blattella germanica]|nr:hypothetical protein C0J52_22219 [Blattella germanica]
MLYWEYMHIYDLTKYVNSIIFFHNKNLYIFDSSHNNVTFQTVILHSSAKVWNNDTMYIPSYVFSKCSNEIKINMVHCSDFGQ